MNINELTIGQAKELAGMFGNQHQQSPTGLNGMIGKKVIIRTYSAGVWFGELSEKSGSEVTLKNARRMWRWWAAESISLSAVANWGVNQDKSKIVSPVESVWLDAIEIIQCTEIAIKSLEDSPYVKTE